jgi:bacterial/archaeal transporter family protein
MSAWLLPTLGYVVTVGLLGVTSKLALRDMSWQELMLWLPIAYAAYAIGLAAIGTRFPTGSGWGWAAASSACGGTALVLLSVALAKGEASRVVPISSVYPLVTVVASVAFLSERFTLTRGVGTALVVLGVVLLSR